MTRQRAGLGFGIALASVTAATTWIVLLSWRAFTTVPEATSSLFYLGALVALIGASARWLRVPGSLVLLLQVAVAGGYTLGQVTGSVLPTPSALGDFTAAFGRAVDSAQQFRAPVPPEAPSINPILLSCGAGVLVLADALVGGLRRVPLAGLLLLTVYCVPVSITGEGLPLPAFVVLAVGFMMMLHLVHVERVTRWGRDVDPARSGGPGLSVRTGAVAASAINIGLAATALALVLPMALPTYEVTLFDGSGPGKREIQVEDPLVDLRRDLDRGADIPLLRVTTPQRDPSYLRIAVLTRFNGDTWTPGDRDIPDDQVARGTMPPLVGVTEAAARTQWPYRVEVSDDFESRWLPTTPQVASMNVIGDWRYDTTTMDFMSTEKDRTTAGMDYAFTGVTVEPDAELLDQASSGITSIGSSSFAVPASVTPQIRDLAAEVTAGETTRFRKARALQRWFREGGGFVYSTDNIDEVAEGTLTEFLDESGRVGYCEQFAASMAIMARILRIPARVAVGFLKSDSVGPNTYEFSSHDLHAWPELFFPGAGWVRFEPTPGTRAASVPGYTRAELVDNPSASPSPRATQSPEARARQPQQPEATAADSDNTSLPWDRIVLVVAALVLLLVVAIGPALVRRRRCHQRLDGDLEDLWCELRDHVTDLGHQWPVGLSPRRTAVRVSAHFGAPGHDGGRDRPRTGPDQDPEAVRALDRLVEQLERLRYSRAAAPDREQARQDVLVIESALDHGVGARVRRRARWLPRSLRQGRTPSRSTVVGPEQATHTRVGAEESLAAQ